MQQEASAEHKWLMNLVGEWEFHSSCPGPDGEKMESRGREVVRALGDLWVVGEMTGQMPGGGEMTAIMTVGYDTRRKKFVGSWVGSPMTHMFVYEGDLDTASNTLTLNCTGPSFADPAKDDEYQDIVVLRGREERKLFSQVRGPDGKWNRFMEGTFKRVR